MDAHPAPAPRPIHQSSLAPTLPDEFRAAFGEPLAAALDLSTWEGDLHLGELHGRLEHEVRSSLAQELPARRAIRERVFPRLAERDQAPPGAGVYRAKLAELERVQRGLLFTGAVEACNGIAVTHESLALTVTQIGICLVSYHAEAGSWVHRLYRRDLRQHSADDPEGLAIGLLNRRHDAADVPDVFHAERLSDIARRGVMAYAERAALLERGHGSWWLGHGHPLPIELLTGAGSPDLMQRGLALLRRFVARGRFVFVPTAMGDRALLTLGDALEPGEYLILATLSDHLERVLKSAHLTTAAAADLRAFAEEIGPSVVVGCYRASPVGPARAFFARLDQAHEAALIALADSRLHEHRGFPALLDLADALCRASFGAPDFAATLRDAYAVAGRPYEFNQEFGRRG
jgi:hypothetical protein